MKTHISLLCAGLCSSALLFTAFGQSTAGSASSGPPANPATGNTPGITLPATGINQTSTTAPNPAQPAPNTQASSAAAVNTTNDATLATPPTSTTTTTGSNSMSITLPSGLSTTTPGASTTTSAATRGTEPIGPQTITTPMSDVTGGVPNPSTGAIAPPIPTTLPSAALNTLVDNPPPHPVVEEVPASPGGDQMWVAGHYSRRGGQWTWVSGQWTVPPTPGATWVEGRYDASTRRWTEGQWMPAGNAPSRGAGVNR